MRRSYLAAVYKTQVPTQRFVEAVYLNDCLIAITALWEERMEIQAEKPRNGLDLMRWGKRLSLVTRVWWKMLF